MPGSTSRTVVHIIRAATYDEQGLETDLWETTKHRRESVRRTPRTLSSMC